MGEGADFISNPLAGGIGPSLISGSSPDDVFSDLFGNKESEEIRREFQFFPGIFGGAPDFQRSGQFAGLAGALLGAPTLNQTAAQGGEGGQFSVSSGGTTPTQAGQTTTLQGRGSPPPFQGVGRATSAFQDPLQQALLNPQFGATTASEQALLESISSQTQGASAVRGLGPATQGALAQNLAPALIGLRQQRVGNLQSALGQDLGFGVQQRGQDISGLLSGRGQDISVRGQDISTNQQRINQLLQLAQLSRPDLIGTGENLQRLGTPGIIPGLSQLLPFAGLL